MNRFGILFKPLMWFMAILLAAFVAGCGSGGGGGGGGGGENSSSKSASNPGTVCTQGAACVNLRTAGSFVILTKTGITDVPTSAVTGNVGVSPATGADNHLTCTEVTGSTNSVDAAGPAPCSVMDPATLSQAVLDTNAAVADATGKPVLPANVNKFAGNIGGQTITAGNYNWTTGVSIATATDVTLSGSATDVWVFQVMGGGITQANNTHVILTGGARPENVFWFTPGVAAIGTGAHFQGVLLSGTSITLGAGATVTGRLFANTDVTLISDTITRPGP